MGKFCRGLLFVSYGSNADGKMNYESKAELRNFLFFSCVFLSLSFSQRPLQRLFVRCLKVFAPVALKASDKKESFGIMVILQVVKRNTNERMRKDKKFKRIYNFARILNAKFNYSWLLCSSFVIFLFLTFNGWICRRFQWRKECTERAHIITRKINRSWPIIFFLLLRICMFCVPVYASFCELFSLVI